ncbi:MAG: putative bifunctional diguanylate cyclase/phosphodiesterase, partial [Pontibacterium sp.]
KERQALENRVLTAFLIVILGAFLVVISLYMVAKKLTKNISMFQQSFDHSTEKREYIAVENIFFDEFKQIATTANKIVGTLDAQARELEHKVFHDALTLLPNRLFGYRKLSEMISHAGTESKQVALYYIDLDNFKHINDSSGHSVGDMMLISMAERLRHVVKDDSRVARLGGDEFTVISPLVDDLAEVEQLAIELRSCFDKSFQLNDSMVYASVSIGFSVYPHDGLDAEVLLRNADSAMYEAKRSGKNAYRRYLPIMTDEAVKRSRLAGDLREAIDNKEFELVFQPQWSIADEKIVGAEALIRWRHPTRGIITPNQFINFAESSGQIQAIGQWVLTEACNTIKRWENAGCCPDRVAVNISFRQFENTSMRQCVQEALESSGASPERLELEVTEGSLMRDEWRVVDGFSALKETGVALSIDDFGTGYSSLSRLKALPIDKLKIDKAFVADLETGEDDREIARAIIAMGRSLKLKVIAEGVETHAQLAFLSQEGCHEVQGYLFSTPLTEHEFTSRFNASLDNPQSCEMQSEV